MRFFLQFNFLLAANIFLLLGCASEPNKNPDMAAAERIVAAVKRQQTTTKAVDLPSQDKTRQAPISKSDQALSAPKPKDTTPAWAKNLILTFDRIESDYFEPVNKQKLVDACISALPEQIKPLKADGDSIKKQLNDIGELLNNFPKVEAQAAIDSCVTAAVSSLGNKYDQYLGPKKYNELNTSMVSDSGVGIELAPDPAGARFVSAIECALGQTLGILKDDVITHIDSIDLSGRSVEEIAKMMRVGFGPDIATIVRRKGVSAPFYLAIKRTAILKNSMLYGCLLDSDVAYFEISQLQKPVLVHLAESALTLTQSANSRPFKAVILDLRLNGGGLLPASIGVAAAFLPPNVFITELRGRTDDSNRKFFNVIRDYRVGGGSDPLANLPPSIKSAPMVVLVGPRTAAGAEIVVSALQDYKRATVLGMSTAGQGTVQTIFPLSSEAALKLTTSRVYRPNHESLGKITPDIIFDMPYLFRSDNKNDKTAVNLPRDKIGLSKDPAVARALEILLAK